jgi:hypothetical protein
LSEAVPELIAEAREALRQLGFDAVRSNERSAMTLLALLDLKPGTPWSAATDRLSGVTPLMAWIARNLGRVYAPNSRETIRRQTLHQFVDAGLVAQNPDDPGRPVNSGKNVYKIDLIRQMIEVFCPRWTPGGRVLYVGDAGTSDPVYDSHGFTALGKGDLDKHSKLPDLVVHLEDRRCLILLEAAGSHGPVDSKRRRELAGVFENTTPGAPLPAT